MFSASILSLSVSVPFTDASEQQPPAVIAPTQLVSGGLMHPQYAKVIGRMAYVMGLAYGQLPNRSQTITKAPKPGLLAGFCRWHRRGMGLPLTINTSPARAAATRLMDYLGMNGVMVDERDPDESTVQEVGAREICRL